MKIKRKKIIVVVSFSIFLILFMGTMFLVNLKSAFTRWTKEAELLASDGFTYSFMNHSFLQGQIMKLVRELKGDPNSYEELGSNNGDFPRSWASVIRPAGADDKDYGQLYLSPANQIVGIRYAQKCYFVYDIDNNKFYGHGEVEETSPFILLDAKTKLHEADILATILSVLESGHWGAHGGKTENIVTATRSYLPGCPRPRFLQEGLNHTNKDVVKISKWLIAIQNDGLSKPTEEAHAIIDYAIKRADSKNMVLRKTALKIPGYFQIPYSEKIMPYLKQALYGKTDPLSSDAAMSLGRIGKKAFPVLYKCLESEDSSIRFYGLLGFRSAGSIAISEIPKIEVFLNDKDSGVRRQAELAIDAIKN